jgi:CDP-diacylglycerol--serine O-phosphatidyltransferase
MFRRRRPRRISGLSINKLIPNILTLLALCAGLTAIRFGLHQKWESAVLSIVLAGLLDGLDGRVARLLQGTSKFGAELDSLSDFVSFGVAPAMVLYFWSMQSAGGIGWALVLLYAVCMALRLARFNTMIGEPDLPAWAYNFFTGVPAPAAAGLVMLPMMVSFQDADGGLFTHPLLNGVVLVLVSFLMVSKIPTFSGKRFRIPHRYVLPVMLVMALLAAFLVTAPWATVTGLALLYGATIPFSAVVFNRLKRHADGAQGLDQADIPDSTAKS